MSGTINREAYNPTETKPVFMFHGNYDPYVPYNSGYTFYDAANQVIVYGSAQIAQRLKANNTSFCFITGKDIGHTYKPQCRYPDSQFPIGYPMNWYPDMLAFIKNSILCGNLNQLTKTVECTLTTDCSLLPTCCATQLVTPANTSPNKDIPTIVNIPVSVCQPTTTNEHCHAFSFDGGDYVKIPSYPTLNDTTGVQNFLTNYTIEFWFKKNTTIPNNSIKILFNAFGTGSSSFAVGLLGENKVWFQGKNKLGDTYENEYITPALSNTWHHFKIYMTGTSFKLDGTQIATNINTGDFVWGFYNVNWLFGGTGVTVTSDNINYSIGNASGQMDDIKIWKGITAYNNTTSNANICPTQTNLLGYYKFNVDGQVVKDETNFHHDGTKGNTTIAESSDPTYVTNCNTSARIANTNIISNPTTNPVETRSNTIGNNGKEILSVYPNPSKDKPTIAFVAAEEGVGTLEITDMKGNILVQNSNIIYKNGVTLLNDYLPSFTSGMYILKFKTSANAYSDKFTIIK